MPAGDTMLAIDLGAESGRGVLGRFDGTRLQLEEILRFPNQPVAVGDTLYWDILNIFANVRDAIEKARAAGGLRSVGIDTWGVDFGLLDGAGRLIANPVHYRDRRTEGMMQRAFEIMPRAAIFNATGNMFLELNTLYQLLALRLANDPTLDIAERMLNVPDLLHYWLSGTMAHELTIASTTQCMAADRADWAWDLLRQLDIPTGLFGDIIPPATRLGSLRTDGAVSVVTPASHDTGSAVMAVPGQGDGIAWISSGTWSVVGVVTGAPLVTPEVLAWNFTNESLGAGRNRASRNVMGLWILQECNREWQRQGADLSYADLVQLADGAEPLRSLIDPDDPQFFRPGHMVSGIKQYCAGSGQPAPESPGEIARCIFESLALAYRRTIQWLEELTDRSIERIHIVGGGSRNPLLCRLTADATRRSVVAGPAEATAIGNLLAQALANGRIGSAAEMIDVVAQSFPTEEFTPGGDGAWDDAFARFQGFAGGGGS
ncbi:MAG: rhamnulokinase [Armatimonadota bacterium]|nr:MAG: rhamnulokinase [Armatimonadota bacterium]